MMLRPLTICCLLPTLGLVSCEDEQNAAKTESPEETNPLFKAPANVASPPDNARRTNDGLTYIVLKKPTSAAHIRRHDIIKMEYSGWTTDGKMFDSSILSGKLFQMRADQIPLPQTPLIQGWKNILPKMKLGEKRRVWIPAELAYGVNPQNPNSPAGDLVFDIEIKEVDRELPAPATPTDLRQPPADAKRHQSGLISKILKKGEGDARASLDQYAIIHYSCWTMDGELYETTRMRNQTVGVPLKYTIKAWQESLTEMAIGEQRRIWVPAALAYGSQSPTNAPKGSLVFDLELVEIRDRGQLKTELSEKLKKIGEEVYGDKKKK